MSQKEDNILRIRRLLEDPRKEVVCLNDLIIFLATMVNDVSTLEVANEKKPLERHKRDLRSFATLLDEYRFRIKTEVTRDILKFHAEKPKGAVRGRPENILEANEKRRKAKEEENK